MVITRNSCFKAVSVQRAAAAHTRDMRAQYSGQRCCKAIELYVVFVLQHCIRQQLRTLAQSSSRSQSSTQQHRYWQRAQHCELLQWLLQLNSTLSSNRLA
eukprot:911-Heterococcus_DN1.PRE.2